MTRVQRIRFSILVSAFLVSSYPAIAQQATSGAQVKRITSDGTVERAAISPNGKYAALLTRDRGVYALWMQQLVSGGKSVALVPGSGIIHTLVFSPDSKRLYFSDDQGLKSIPVTGGTPKLLVPGVKSAGLSPDGRKVAFLREGAVVIRDVGGERERRIEPREGTAPVALAELAPRWNDGNGVAAFTKPLPDGKVQIGTLNLTDGSFRGVRKWKGVADVHPARAGLLTIAVTEGETTPAIWFVDAGGNMRRITNDASRYVGLSTTTDGKLLTTAIGMAGNLWMVNQMMASADPITSGRLFSGSAGLSFFPDGKRVVYTSDVAGQHLQLWTADLTDRKTRFLFKLPDAAAAWPAVSPDGKEIAFVAGMALWKVNADGTNPVALTKTFSESEAPYLPHWSSDGRWIYYQPTVHETTGAPLFRVSREGGAPEKVADTGALAAVSPDGTMVASFLGEPAKLVVTSLSTGSFIVSAEARSIKQPLVWGDDGRAVFFPENNAGATNIWKLSVPDGVREQVTNFPSDFIIFFDRHGNGTIVSSRAAPVGDAVLLTNVRGGS